MRVVASILPERLHPALPPMQRLGRDGGQPPDAGRHLLWIGGPGGGGHAMAGFRQGLGGLPLAFKAICCRRINRGAR